MSHTAQIILCTKQKEIPGTRIDMNRYRDVSTRPTKDRGTRLLVSHTQLSPTRIQMRQNLYINLTRHIALQESMVRQRKNTTFSFDTQKWSISLNLYFLDCSKSDNDSTGISGNMITRETYKYVLRSVSVGHFWFDTFDGHYLNPIKNNYHYYNTYC